MSGGYGAADRERWLVEDPAHRRPDRDDFARDRGRVVHSAALRRLSAKTQVLSPGSDDFVRTRLTHSLEVAQIGREFGAALGCDPDVVDTACLAHDLGHPPFGHTGEEALDALAADVGGFEGNAQTLRLLSRLEPKRVHPGGRSAGLNLTRASLDAATKYPWFRGAGPGETPKFGVYEEDRDVFEWLREPAQPGRRCLEAQVMDWADDVAYSVHDVEDAIASRRLDPGLLADDGALAPVVDLAHTRYAPELSEAALAAAVGRLRAHAALPTAYRGSRADLARLKDMTSGLIGRFLVAAQHATRARHGSGRLTRYAADLVVPAEIRAECAVLKAVAAHFVMFAETRRAQTEAQRRVLAELADAYAADPHRRMDPDFAADHEAAPDDAGRLRVVVDQIASLTDDRAVALHRQWVRSS